MIDLDRANNLMDSVEWLAGHAQERLYDELRGQMEHLRRNGDTFSVPSPAHPYAWRAAWKIFVRLREREHNSPQRMDDVFFPQTSQNYADYLRDLNEMMRLLRYKKITSQEAAYLGLERGDLDDVKPDDRGLIPIDAWAGAAGRISQVLGKFQSFTDEGWAQERLKIPHAMELRRLETARRRAEEKEAELEARLAALESVPRTNTNETENAA